ncbi:hypothetical protein OZ656_07165 [Marinobacter sp. LM1]|jgi:hypothetical protein|uniref:hypothetical protein n=1 Tax=Marinobacter sp. LM1 TaxID=3003349 RepID=UPI001A1604F9|nr:hypothetical protein [Alphaproteobacteria bacterium]|tara:strand:+ start:1035 stop:1751 length:717 start_codon:yes stop_codon:yes gene_type:complete
MSGKSMFMIARVICSLVVFGLSPGVATAENDFSIANSITRFQVRHVIDTKETASLTFSSFLQAKNKTFLLGIVDYETDYRRHATNGRIELNLGGPFPDSPMGWIVRGRNYYKEDPAAAAGGLQLNFNKLPGLGSVLKNNGITTFLQLLRNANDPYFGDFEVLHYYSVDIVQKRLALRGYNIFTNGGGNGSVINLWADLIYSMNSRFDFYYRIDHVSDENGYLGQPGTTHYLGLRVNWY